ncbi:MAG: Low molecular weight protein tyrosine phosphatase (EC [Candidatus Burkholderia crenata]|nr:MAG: Low molecular weight protein tyrosine phosphatase (EC [Candidatus Burkholderia crenata]
MVSRIDLARPAQAAEPHVPLKPNEAWNLMNTIAVCFVCLGNICRSPSAEAVMLD